MDAATSTPSQPTRMIHLFTDGACSGNPGPGGWAYVLRDLQSGTEKECSGGLVETTNNQMEMLAVIRGLQALKRPCKVTLYSDSSYVGQGLSKWMPGWKRNGWRRKVGSKFAELKNADLWKELDRQLQVHAVTFEHVKGHSGHEENERCDQLAVAAYQQFL
ncbi:ribonuclease HI [Rosistilla carotiformis]